MKSNVDCGVDNENSSNKVIARNDIWNWIPSAEDQNSTKPKSVIYI